MSKQFRFDPAKVSAVTAAVGEMPPYCNQAQLCFAHIGDDIEGLYATEHKALEEALSSCEKALVEANERAKEMERRAANCDSNIEHIEAMATRSRATEQEKKHLQEEKSKAEAERVANRHKAQRIRAVAGEMEGVRRQLLDSLDRLEKAHNGLPERIQSVNDWLQKTGRIFADLESTLHEVDRLAEGLADGQLHPIGGYYPRAARMRVQTGARTTASTARVIGESASAAAQPLSTVAKDAYMAIEATRWEDALAKLSAEGLPPKVEMKARTYAKLGAKRLLDEMATLGYLVQRDADGNVVGADNYIRWERNDG